MKISPKISPANPINNIANSDILNSMAEAFAEIEKKDIRVEKATLTQDRFDEMITKRGSLEYLCVNDLVEMTEEEALVGMLWGAKLEIGAENKVYGERGFVPSGLCVYREETGDLTLRDIPAPADLNAYLEAEIKFKTEPMKFESSPSKFHRKMIQLRRNMTIIVHSRAEPIRKAEDNEMNAIDTLREMITEAEFRKYMTHGFLLVKGASGLVYQVFRNRAHTKVWENGQVIEEVCVRIKERKIPPTDNVIAFKILIETSEGEFRKLGNVYNMRDAA